MTEITKLDITMVDQIKKLFREIFMNEPWNDDWSNDDQLYNYILDLIGNRNSLAFGLYYNGCLVGLSLGNVIHWCTGTEYYIQEFCIRTELQGKGLGTKFLSDIQTLIKEKGVTRIFLQTERTVPAYKFYQKNGFVELNEHASLVKEF